ncbi:MAG: cation diffusion facilitator family transporter [Candidatus Goldbacteria bacterium]|nr:cation diffusion facilitator family transporter [Candidatus Goldiibacteriota bacterium]
MEKQKLSYIEGWTSVVINTILFILKYWAGIITGSVAIVADAWHTLSDSLTSLLVIFGAKISVKKPDKEHPFGHGKVEFIIAVIIGVLLFVVGFNFIVESLKKLKEHEIISYNTFSVIVFVISVILKEGLFQFAIILGKKAESKAIVADAWHHRSDGIASLLILIGIFISNKIWWIDGVLGFMVSILIMQTAYSIIKDSSNILLGKEIDKSTEEKIRNTIKDICGTDQKMHHLHIHEYGEHKEATFHIKFPDETTIEQAHNTANKIENALKYKHNIDATIHLENESDRKRDK